MLSACLGIDKGDICCAVLCLLNVSCEHTVLPCCRAGPQQLLCSCTDGVQRVESYQ